MRADAAYGRLCALLAASLVTACAARSGPLSSVANSRVTAEPLPAGDTAANPPQHSVQAPAPTADTQAAARVAQAAAAPPGGGSGQTTPPQTTTPQATTPPQAAPGQFTVDVEAANRALERTLVTTGALLLPAGTFEVEPAFTFERTEQSFPRTVTSGGTTLIASSQVRQNTYDAELIGRVGLPFSSQIDVDVPYRFLDQRTVTSVGLSPQSATSVSGSGLSDASVTLSKGLLSESGWRPDLIAAVQYSADTGATVHGINLGNGYNIVRGTLTALKRVDPLAFIASLGYGIGLKNGNLDPGNEVDTNFGVAAAMSPETSLQFFLQQRFIDDATVSGVKVAGSGQTQSTFIAGTSVIVAPRTLLDVAVGIGLTSDTPKYSIRVSLPIRF